MLDNVRDFVQGNVNYYTSLAPFQQEQVDLRAFLCESCLDNGKCVHCKCKTPNMFYAPNKVDSENKWAEFLSLSQWEALKNNIEAYKIFIDNLNAGIKQRLLRVEGDANLLQGGASQ